MGDAGCPYSVTADACRATSPWRAGVPQGCPYSRHRQHRPPFARQSPQGFGLRNWLRDGPGPGSAAAGHGSTRRCRPGRRKSRTVPPGSPRPWTPRRPTPADPCTPRRRRRRRTPPREPRTECAQTAVSATEQAHSGGRTGQGRSRCRLALPPWHQSHDRHPTAIPVRRCTWHRGPHCGAGGRPGCRGQSPPRSSRPTRSPSRTTWPSSSMTSARYQHGVERSVAQVGEGTCRTTTRGWPPASNAAAPYSTSSRYADCGHSCATCRPTQAVTS